MGKQMQEILNKYEALRLAKEVENIKLDTDINISTEDMAKLVSNQYKKTHNSTDQSKSYEHNQIFNDIIPLGTDIDNGDIYNLETRQTIREL